MRSEGGQARQEADPGQRPLPWSALLHIPGQHLKAVRQEPDLQVPPRRQRQVDHAGRAGMDHREEGLTVLEHPEQPLQEGPEVRGCPVQLAQPLLQGCVVWEAPVA